MFSFWTTKSKSKAERWLEGQLSDIHSSSARQALLSLAGELDKRLAAASKAGVEPFPLVLAVAGNRGLQQDDVVELLRGLLVHLEVLADGGKHLHERPTASVFSADRLPFSGQHHEGCSCRLWRTPDCKVQVLCDQECTAYRSADNVLRLQLENYTVDQLAELFENKAKALGWTSAGWRTTSTSGDLKPLLSNVAEEHRNALNGNLVVWVVCCLRNTVDPKQLTFYLNDFDAALYRYKMDRPGMMKSIARSLPGIAHLSLPGCGIDDAMAKELASGLSDNTCLRSLELVANRFTSQGLRSIGERVSPALAHLDVSHNPLGDAGAAELAAIMPRKPSLVSVGFASVNLTDKGIKAVLVAVFERCPNILKLTLHEDGYEATCRDAQHILHQNYQWMFRDGSIKTTKRIRLQLPLLRFLHDCPVVAAAGLPQSVIMSVLNAKLDGHNLFLCGSESEDTTSATTVSLPGLTSLLEESGIGQGLTSLSLRSFDYRHQPGLWAALPSTSWVANLETLALHGQRLTSAMLALQAPFWQGMCNLRTLCLSNNRLSKLDGSWWAPLQKLERLNLAFNRILDVDPQSFGSLPSLYYINLAENRITVPRSTKDFPQLPGLAVLNLDSNPCNSGEPQTDEELVYNSVNSPERRLTCYGPGLGQSDYSAVTQVDLSWNSFDEIPQALTWKIFGNLDKLNLSHNNITALPREPTGLPFCPIQLTHLDLRHNALAVLTTNFFSQMPQLKRLHLDHNRIAAIKEGAFAGLGELEALTISNNQLNHLSVLNLHALLEPLSALRVLDLSCNPLMRTVGAMFGNSAGSLEVVQMSQASIFELHAATFQGCTQLKRLDLHDNGIRSLSHKLFCSLERLETLDISYNLLSELPWDSLPDLKDLDTSWNRLETQAIAPSVPILQRLTCKARVCLEGNYLDLQSDIWRYLDQGRVELQFQLPAKSDGLEESPVQIDRPVLIVGERVVPLSRNKWQDVAYQADYVDLMAKGKRIALPHISSQAFETVVLPANAISEGEKLTSLWEKSVPKPGPEALAMRKAAIITRGDTLAEVFKGPELSRRTLVDQALSSIAGLTDIKQKMQQLADADERNIKPHMLHVVLKGNTGVGKTTVAQAIAEVYFRLGLVSKRSVVEVNREHLVGTVVGGTEERTEARIREARGGVMFVDEAYTLNGDQYGHQAITLFMNHLNRDQVVFIFAGYEENMNEFLKVNQGFRQRITYHFTLPDYTPLHLADILKVKIEHEQLRLPEDVLGNGLVEMMSRNFPDTMIRGANGAIVRIILEGLKIMRRPEGNHALSIGDIEAAIARARAQLSQNTK